MRTVDDLNKYMKIHGNAAYGDFEYNDDLLHLVQYYNEYQLGITRASFKVISKRKMKKDAYKFINDYYPINKVGYLTDKKVTRVMLSTLFYNKDDFIKVYNDAAKMISPFKLPIKYKKANIFDGCLSTSILLREDAENDDYLDKLNLYFQHIELPKKVTELSIPSYVHEITHALIESHKGLTHEFYNSEVLPIFNELLYAYLHNNDMLKVLISNRLNSIYNSFNSIYEYNNNEGHNAIENKVYTEFDYHVDIKYLLSTLKAFCLLASLTDEEFISSSYIIHQAARVFEGHRSVEEFLSDVGITNDKCYTTDAVSKILKK